MHTTERIATHTVGVDLGDRKSAICRLDADGEVIGRRTIATSREFFEAYFSASPKARLVMEVGTRSPWVSRLLEELGHEGIVATPAKIRARKGRRNSDRSDAERLARQGRADPKLLWPIEHRGKRAQADQVLPGTRDCLVKCRTLLINYVRGSVRPVAGRIPKCSSESFHRTAPAHIPEALVEVLNETMEEIARLTQRIRALEKQAEAKAEAGHVSAPEAEMMSPLGVPC